MTTSRNDRRLAKRRLARLMPLAGARAAEAEINGEGLNPGHMSPLGATVIPHATVDRLDGVHVYRTQLGKYHADFHFRDMPDYLPSVIGTPKERPLGSEAEAEAWAVGVLTHLILAKRQGRETSPPKPERIPFEVYGHTLFVPPFLIETLRESGPFDPSDACFAIEETFKAMGNEISEKSLARVPRSTLDMLFVAVASLLIAGMPRYPLRWPLPD